MPLHDLDQRGSTLVIYGYFSPPISDTSTAMSILLRATIPRIVQQFQGRCDMCDVSMSVMIYVNFLKFIVLGQS